MCPIIANMFQYRSVACSLTYYIRFESNPKGAWIRSGPSQIPKASWITSGLSPIQKPSRISARETPGRPQ